MKTKLFKSILSFALALALVFGSSAKLGAVRELQPQCDYDEIEVMQ